MNNDEIDLQELAVKVIRFLKKHFSFVIIISFLGGITSLGVYLLLPKAYESKLLLTSDILTENYAKEITENLNILIKEKNLNTLSLRLSLSNKEAEQILKVEVEIKSAKKENDSKEPDAIIFVVNVDTKDKNILGNLQKGIIDFVQNNEFIKIRTRQRKDYYLTMIKKVELEINSLDSLKRRFFLGQPVYSKNSEMILVDPTNISSKIIELNKALINYKNDLELVESIHLVEGFTSFEKPSSPRLSILLVIGFAGGFWGSIAVLLLSHLFKLANQPA